MFSGYDTYLGARTKIVERDGKYWMDGHEMEKNRHPNMPKRGLSLTMKERVGRPNIYYVVRPYKVDIYINCEFGKCEFRRSVTGECCAFGVSAAP